MIRHCLIWIVWIACISPAVSQQFVFKKIATDPRGEIGIIHHMAQTSDGLIWLGTDVGVYAFDGRQYLPFPRPDHIKTDVTLLQPGPNGQLYCGFKDGHLMQVGIHTTSRMISSDSIHQYALTGFVFVSQDEWWVTTYGKGVWHVRDDVWHRVTHEALRQIEDIYDVVQDPSGHIWMATDQGILCYRSSPSETFQWIGKKEGLPDELITHLRLTPNGNVIAGSYEHGVTLFDDKRKSHPLFSPRSGEHNLVDIASDASTVWICNGESVWRKTEQLDAIEIGLPAFIEKRIESILVDHEKNLWIASGNKLYIANTAVSTLDPGLQNIQSILHDGFRLWIGTADGLYTADPDGTKISKFLLPSNVNVLSLHRDAEGYIWVGTFGQGLFIIDPRLHHIRKLTESDGLTNSSILNIDSKDRTVWLATLGGITQISYRDNPSIHPVVITELRRGAKSAPGYIYDVFVAPDGRVWFGTDGQGLYFLNADTLVSWPVYVPLPDSTWNVVKTVYSIAQDDRDQVWFTSTRGLLLSIDSMGNVVHQSHSPQAVLSSLIHTPASGLLLISDATISRLPHHFKLYPPDDQSQPGEFAPHLHAVTEGADGALWIADTDHIVRYMGVEEDATHQIRLLFTSASPSDWFSTQTTVLKPDSNFLDVRFAGLWYRDPSQVRYRYWMEGFDADWIYTNEGRAVYSHLPAGTYRFVLEVSGDALYETSLRFERDIIVLPPFYQRWWFLLASGLLILAGIVIFIQLRIRRISKWHALEKEKTNFQLNAIQAQVNPHFLFNSFNTLSSIIEEDQKAAVEYVDQLAAFFRGALMHRHDELITLTAELDIVRNFIYILKTRYGDNILIEEEIRHTAGWIAPLSLQMLVENAIKHNTVSAGRKLHIRIHTDDEWVSVTNPIQPKFTTHQESTGFGLSSLQTRYAYLTTHNIEIRRDANTFSVRIPVIHKEKPI